MKKFLKISAIVIAVLIVLLIAIPLLLKGKIADIVKTEANKMLNAKLDFEELDISLLRNFPKATIELKNLSVVGIGEFDGDTLVAADEIAAAVDLLSLFGDSGYEISYVTLDRPIVNAFIHKGGTVNWERRHRRRKCNNRRDKRQRIRFATAQIPHHRCQHFLYGYGKRNRLFYRETESCPYGKTQRHADRLTMQGFDTGYFTFDG